MANNKNQRYIALASKVGRMKAGIHHHTTHLIGKLAYVKNGDTTATVVPRNCTFEKLEDAQRYLAGKGKLLWVVEELDQDRGYDVYEAWVKEMYSYVYGYGSSHNWYRIIVRKGSRDVKKDRHRDSTTLFDTRVEAERNARARIVRALKEITIKIRRLSKQEITLRRVKGTLRA